MKQAEFQALMGRVSNLTNAQRRSLIVALSNAATASDAVALIDRQFAVAPRCPHCVSDDIRTWSKPKPLTRYKCRACRKTFTALTGTPLQHVRRRDAWLAYAQALADGLSLRKAARRCEIVLDTAFRWRHRFLEMSKGKKAISMSGIVEVDEAYVLKSQKGARLIVGRSPRTRGGKARKGHFEDYAAVLIARDRTGAQTDAMLEKVDAMNITSHLGPVVRKGTLLISDGKGVYAMFARARKLLHVWVVIKKGEHTWAGAHIQNVNAYISGLKTWMVRFRGVATKYLESYLGWRRQIDRAGDDLPADRWMIAAVT